MRFRPRRRLAAACRLSSATFFWFTLSLFVSPREGAAAGVAGQVVDPTGRPLPRAYVRVLDGSGDESTAVFTDETGHFSLNAPPSCRVEAALNGFQTATVPCGPSTLRIVLPIAPIREALIVTATRTEAPTSQVGASTTVFTAEDVERRQEPLLADLLVGTPGAMILRSGGPGTVTSLHVRGGESDYNKILLDGVPLNEPGGSFYLSNLTTENLDRVEVVRGAYSSLFGSDAMSSVVQLFTRRGDNRTGRPRITAQADGGTYGTLHTSASLAGATSRVDYSLAAARLDTDNRVPNSALENNTFSGNFGVALGRTATLRFVGRTEREHVGTPGATAFGRPDLDAFFERHDGIGSVSFDQQLTPAMHQRVAYSLASSYQQSTNLREDAPYTPTYRGRTALFESSDFLADSANDLVRHHASYQANLHVRSNSRRGDHTLSVIADWDGERATSTDRLFGSRGSNSRDNFGVAAQNQILWPRVFVTVGGRVERNESFGTAFVPRGSAVFVLHQASESFGDTRLRVGAGTGVKEPTLLESFSLSPYFRGNPELKPERSRSIELGLEQRLSNDRAKLDITYFDNRAHDVIQLITTNPATFEGQYFNGGVTRSRGIELGGEAAPNSLVRARAGYTLLDGKVLEGLVPFDTVFQAGKELFRRPKHSGSVGVTLTWSRLMVDVNGAFIGRFVDNDFGLFSPSFTENPGYTQWDARAAVRLTRHVTAILLVDNLTNRDYSAPLGYQPLLRTVRAGVRVGL